MSRLKRIEKSIQHGDRITFKYSGGSRNWIWFNNYWEDPKNIKKDINGNEILSLETSNLSYTIPSSNFLEWSFT